MHHAVVRRYTGSRALADAIVTREQEIHDLLRSVPGFITYYAIRDGDDLVTVTVCRDQAGTDESTRLAAAWIRENLPDAGIAPPDVSEGEVVIDIPG